MNVCSRTVPGVLLLTLVLGLPARGADVEVRLVPTLNPGTTSVPGPSALTIAPSTNYSLEFWVADISEGGSAVTGIAGAFIDIAWDEFDSATSDAQSPLHWVPPWSLFQDGTIDNPMNMVTNFGAGESTFLGQGHDEFSLVGYVDYAAGAGLGSITFSATEGIDEIGRIGADIEPSGIRFVGATVTVPEPGSVVLLGMAGLVCLRRRRSA